MLVRPVLVAMCLSLIPQVSTSAGAQTSDAAAEPDVPEKIGKNLRALRVDAAAAPHIDGRLDDPAWVKADRIDDFVQVEPNNMAGPTELTVVQVAYAPAIIPNARRSCVRGEDQPLVHAVAPSEPPEFHRKRRSDATTTANTMAR